MTEGGRSIVWKAVEVVLKKWSRLGKIGTNKRYKSKSADTKINWNEKLHSDLMDTLPEGKRFYHLHQEEIDDISAEISQEIEDRLEEIIKKAEDLGEFKLINGGKNQKGY